MATLHLPDDPHLGQLRSQARELQRAVRTGDADAIAIVAEHHPKGALAEDARTAFTLSAAQLVIARRYGFASWPRLKRHLDLVAEISWRPDSAAAGTVAERFVRLACLTYDDDNPAKWSTARDLLADDPDLADTDLYVAVTTANVSAVRRLLAADPTRASLVGGGNRWAPIFYLAYARQDPAVSEQAVLDTARLLLDHGADPNTGYLWHGLPSPFTLVTGCLGEGERGPVNQPEHPHGFALARLLLEAGADPNDSQGLYNRMFRPGTAHLELLFEFGLGTGDGGPWQARLGSQLQSPTEMVRGQLAWAAGHGMLDRVKLLVEHGVDVVAPLRQPGQRTQRTAIEIAALNGHSEILEFLSSLGGSQPTLSPTDAFMAAALVNDRGSVDMMIAADPDVVTAARDKYPSSVLRAAVLGNAEAVDLFCSLGFDVNAFGRRDVDVEQPWETALHHAAAEGDVELARLLLTLGARTDVRDKRFDATPLEWAEHTERDAMVELLRPLTPDR